LVGGGQGLGDISSVSASPRDDMPGAPDVSAISFADSADGDTQQAQSAAAERGGDERGGEEEDQGGQGGHIVTPIYCEPRRLCFCPRPKPNQNSYPSSYP